MKKIILIGASGYVGSAIMKEALNRGMQVTAIVRHPEKITIKDANLTVKKGDVTDIDKIARLSKGADIIVSDYNPGWNNPDIYEETLSVYPKILEAVKKSGVPRFLMVGGAGTLFVEPGLRLIDSGMIPETILPGVKSLGEFYLNTLSKEKEVDWVFFSPAANLFPGKRTGKFRLGKDNMIVDDQGESSVSVEDYAVAMIDEVEYPTHHYERFTIGY